MQVLTNSLRQRRPLLSAADKSRIGTRSLIAVGWVSIAKSYLARPTTLASRGMLPASRTRKNLRVRCYLGSDPAQEKTLPPFAVNNAGGVRFQAGQKA